MSLSYLVRAVDAGGKEETNIREILIVPVEVGTVGVVLPAEPRLVEARAISGGRVELEWLYDPAYEYLGPGAAYEARIYWDAGMGEVDFSESHATVLMNNPSSVGRYAWRSDRLIDGLQYSFCVRIATAGNQQGVETDNCSPRSVSPSAHSPLSPFLVTELT